MSAMNEKAIQDCIERAMAGVQGLEVKPLRGHLSPTNLGLKQARTLCATHLYFGICNFEEMVQANEHETERTHQRALRFLHLWMRTIRTMLQDNHAVKVDLQDHRLHLVFPDDEETGTSSIARALFVADALRQLLEAANELHDELKDARVAAGLEWGEALVVQNGTRGDREPLFLGDPANQAAKLIKNKGPGVYLGPSARKKVQLRGDASTPLGAQELQTILRSHARDRYPSDDIATWKRQLREHARLSDFQFSRPSPPLHTLDFSQIAPANTRRIECAVLFADIDGFTSFIKESMKTPQQLSKAAQCLHVLRKVMRDIWRSHGGLKVRYIGDCMVGVIAEGPRVTQPQETVRIAREAADAINRGFEQAVRTLKDRGLLDRNLKLAIGVEYGPVCLARLGTRGDRDLCLIGAAVTGAQLAQEEGKVSTTALGPRAKALSET